IERRDTLLDAVGIADALDDPPGDLNHEHDEQRQEADEERFARIAAQRGHRAGALSSATARASARRSMCRRSCASDRKPISNADGAIATPCSSSAWNTGA